MADETIEDLHRYTVPYVYRPYPAHVHKPGGAFLVVNSDEEKAAAVEAGWALQPVPDKVDGKAKK